MNPPSDTPDTGSHYFSGTPSRESARHDFTVRAAGRELVLSADTGVFSRHGLDKGTAVFLDAMQRTALPPLVDGDVLCDLGCGTGAIALTLAAEHPGCRVLAVDVNERARGLCAANATRNGLDNVEVLGPAEVPADTRIRVLWSNPPIRIGKDALHDLLLTWLTRLSHDGVAHLVVSKNLGGDSLAAWLNGNSFPTRKISSSKGFRVLEVRPRQ